MSRLPAFFLALLCACGLKVPPEPTYEECEPDSDFYSDMMRDDSCLLDLEQVPEDPEVALSWARAYAAAQGFPVQRKPNKSGSGRFNTTLPGGIWVAPTFEDKTPAEQAATLGHELVHVCQYRAIGDWALMTAYAAYPTFRAALEAPADEMGRRMRVHLGLPAVDPAHHARHSWESHEMQGGMSQDCYAALAEEWNARDHSP